MSGLGGWKKFDGATENRQKFEEYHGKTVVWETSPLTVIFVVLTGILWYTKTVHIVEWGKKRYADSGH